MYILSYYLWTYYHTTIYVSIYIFVFIYAIIGLSSLCVNAVKHKIELARKSSIRKCARAAKLVFPNCILENIGWMFRVSFFGFTKRRKIRCSTDIGQTRGRLRREFSDVF